MRINVECVVSITDDLVITHENLTAVVPAAQAELFIKALRALHARAKDDVARNIALQRAGEPLNGARNGEVVDYVPARIETRPKIRRPQPLLRSGSVEEVVARTVAELPEPVTAGMVGEKLKHIPVGNLHSTLFRLAEKGVLEKEDSEQGKLYRLSTRGTEFLAARAN